MSYSMDYNPECGGRKPAPKRYITREKAIELFGSDDVDLITLNGFDLKDGK